MDIAKLSNKYIVKYLDKSNLDEIVDIFINNPQFYSYTDAKPTKEQAISDMNITPSGIEIAKKHYVGFYDNNELIAIMDLIDGYPINDIAYIGFFMMKKSYQRKGIGSSIINNVEKYLKDIGKNKVRLAIDKGNPESSSFWNKLGYRVIRETDKKLESEKIL